MQKKYINITFCYLLCLSLNLGFISTSKADDDDDPMLVEAIVKVTFPKNIIKEIINFNKNFEQFNTNIPKFNNTSLLVGTVSVLGIGATFTACSAAKKIMDNNSKDKNQTIAISTLIVSILLDGIALYVLCHRKEIANFIFGNNLTP